MDGQLLLEKDDRTGRLSLRIRGSRVVVVIGPIALAVLLPRVSVVAWRLAVGYGTDEGTVVRIERDGFSRWFDDGSHATMRLTVRTPDGRRITRYADEYDLLRNRIEEGDTIIKDAGFGNAPRCPDKKSIPQLLEEARGR